MENDKAFCGVFLRSALCEQECKRHGIGPAADGDADPPRRKYGSVDFHPCALYQKNGILCGVRLQAGVAQWQSSSLPSWLRGFDSLRPLQTGESQGGVMAAAADSKSAIREYVRVRVPLLAPTRQANKTTTGRVSEWSMVQPWKGCVGATPPGVRIPPLPPTLAADSQNGSSGGFLFPDIPDACGGREDFWLAIFGKTHGSLRPSVMV